jgi:hypothetical protein
MISQDLWKEHDLSLTYHLHYNAYLHNKKTYNILLNNKKCNILGIFQVLSIAPS